jgi:uncharacterized membrane protein
VISRAAAVMIWFVTVCHCDAGMVSDAEVLVIVTKRCVMCQAAKPRHESFRKAPKNVILETVGDLGKYAVTIYVQTFSGNG